MQKRFVGGVGLRPILDDLGSTPHKMQRTDDYEQELHDDSRHPPSLGLEMELQCSSVTVTPSGIGKSVTITACHSNSVTLIVLQRGVNSFELS